MRVTVLGSGTSMGVPELRCNCEVCLSDDVKDKRLRASVLLETKEHQILIDCGPDFRQQMLNNPSLYPETLLLTHSHYDHIAGIDDLRPFSRERAIDIYADQSCAETLRQNFSYMFKEHKYPGVPNVNLNIIDNLPFKIGNDTIIPIHLLHYKMPILGFRINDFAYLTDFTSISDEELSKLKNLKVLFIGALRIKEHISHLNLSQAVDLAKKIGSEKTYFIHMAHTIGKHINVNDNLPADIRLSYDGMTLDF